MYFKCQSLLRSGLDEGRRKVKTLNPREGQRENEKGGGVKGIKTELHLIHGSLKAQDTALQLHITISRNKPYSTGRTINQLES